jgi:hypothetical protein
MRFSIKTTLLIITETAILALCSLQCCSTASKKPVVESLPDRPIKITHGDTLIYQIAFTDKSERERFIYSFNQFVKDSYFHAERFDSAGVFTTMRLIPVQRVDNEPRETKGGAPLPDKEPVVGVQPAAGPEQSVAPVEAVRPEAGGSARIYLPRASVQFPFTLLTDAYPFREKIGEDSTAGYFSIDKAAANAITLKFEGKLTNGAGRIVTVLEVIDLWTRFIREHPAEGFALFRSAEGVMELIRGQEAAVRGFQALDDKTIRIRMLRPDADGLDRLRTARLLPGAFKLGEYYQKVNSNGELSLAPNNGGIGPKPFLHECTVRCGGDPNPVLSFSLGRYDAVLLCGAADLDYARRNLLKNGASCTIVERDRYFIGCNLQDGNARDFIRSVLSGADLLNNFVKAEGTPIGAVESDSASPARPVAKGKAPSQEPLKILFRKDDAVSKTVAAKLLADISAAGGNGALIAADEKGYEAALVDGNYGCVVGWAPQNVLFDKSEKLRLASLFFKDETNEEQRIAANREIPLFSIDWYLLAKEKVGLFEGKIGGMYLKK